MSDLSSQNNGQLAVQRAADDLRRGWPVIVLGFADKALMIMPAEAANDATMTFFDGITNAESFLIVTGNRAQALKVADKGSDSVCLERSSWLSPADIVALADPTLDLSSPFKGPFKRLDIKLNRRDAAAIKLVKVARLLPAVVAIDISADIALEIAMTHFLVSASVEDILAVDMVQSDTLKQVASAKVPLEGSDDTRLISFRPTHGSIEHIAIIVGDPNRHDPVLTRIHSECFTGDLLGSLKCDCGDQLKGSIKAISEAGGGVVLYMAQEGRGIGLTSKLKAYNLQDQGYDTVDANTALGFEVDERFFAPAAQMLHQLGFKSVRLMTNNPKKVEALVSYGVDVTERVEHSFEPNEHNINYLATKRDRTGHLL